MTNVVEDRNRLQLVAYGHLKCKAYKIGLNVFVV